LCRGDCLKPINQKRYPLFYSSAQTFIKNKEKDKMKPKEQTAKEFDKKIMEVILEKETNAFAKGIEKGKSLRVCDICGKENQEWLLCNNCKEEFIKEEKQKCEKEIKEQIKRGNYFGKENAKLQVKIINQKKEFAEKIEKLKEFILDNGEENCGECPECCMPDGIYILKKDVKKIFGEDLK
jgi:hypothetical protein